MIVPHTIVFGNISQKLQENGGGKHVAPGHYGRLQSSFLQLLN
jgi:hypothetical protein